VHLRGQCRPGYHSILDRAFPTEKGHSLYIHDLVSPHNLLGRIAEHDIGLALEQYQPDSRNLTVTNKILHYLLGGLAVVATDTDGQKEVSQASGKAIRLCSPDSPSDLAHQITALIKTKDHLKRAQKDALQAAREKFSWEQQIPTLLESVESALSSKQECA
jgi:glycosyltransferase involved in cell wall biosynthesis